MNLCPAKTFHSATGAMVSCSYEEGHPVSTPHSASVGGRDYDWTGTAEPMGLISELVHYVRMVQLPNGEYDECNAVVLATYENGAALQVFTDPCGEYKAALPEPRTRHDAAGVRDTWHLRSECRR